MTSRHVDLSRCLCPWVQVSGLVRFWVGGPTTMVRTDGSKIQEKNHLGCIKSLKLTAKTPEDVPHLEDDFPFGLKGLFSTAGKHGMGRFGVTSSCDMTLYMSKPQNSQAVGVTPKSSQIWLWFNDHSVLWFYNLHSMKFVDVCTLQKIARS